MDILTTLLNKAVNAVMDCKDIPFTNAMVTVFINNNEN